MAAFCTAVLDWALQRQSDELPEHTGYSNAILHYRLLPLLALAVLRFSLLSLLNYLSPN